MIMKVWRAVIAASVVAVSVMAGGAGAGGAAAAATAPAPTTPCPPVAGQPTGGSPAVMVVGDSDSQGSTGDYTWRYWLYEHLVADGVRPHMVGPYNWLYDNVAGRQGSCAYANPLFEEAADALWGRAMADEVSTIRAEVSRYRPQYLLVLLGVDDLAFGRTGVAGLEKHLRTFVANARAGSPGVRIVLGTLLPRNNPHSVLQARITQYNTDLPALAARMSTARSRVVVADDSSAIVPAADYWDGSHPDTDGQIKIAAGFADALAAKFGLGSAYPEPLPKVPPGPGISPILRLTPGNGTISLAWTSSPGATGYIVFVDNVTSGRGWYRLPYPLKLSQSPWTGAFQKGSTFEIRLQADKGTAAGAFSNVVTATLGPSQQADSNPDALAIAAAALVLFLIGWAVYAQKGAARARA